MKKILKKEVIIAFVAGIILSSSIAVYATINASNIDYKNGKTVENALNDLYTQIGSGKGVKDTFTIPQNYIRRYL